VPCGMGLNHLTHLYFLYFLQCLYFTKINFCAVRNYSVFLLLIFHKFLEPDSVCVYVCVTLHINSDVCNWHVLEILLVQTSLKW